MSVDGRRTAEELRVRYEVEPSLRDVYVEGPSDRAFVEFALCSDGDAGIQVYEIDSVEVPAKLLEENGLSVSAKSRVIALAMQLEAELAEPVGQVCCLVDTDCDRVLGTLKDGRLLLYTSGTSLDTVLFDRRLLGKLLGVVILGFPASAADLMGQLLPVLQDRFLQRAAQARLGLPGAGPPLSRACAFSGRRLSYDRDKYITRLLSKVGGTARRDEFIRLIEELRRGLDEDPRTCIHVDDFVELLHLCIHAVKPRRLPRVAQFRVLLRGLLDERSVADLPEIKEISSRLA